MTLSRTPSSRARVPLFVGLVGLFAAACLPARLAAQQTTLTLAGFPLTTTSTSGADFEAGAVSLGSTTFTVNATTNAPTMSPRTATVQVRCRNACPRSGTLPMAGLQWKRADQATWTSITTTYVTVESRQMIFNGANDPWTQTVQWRYQLSWTATPPTAATSFYIQMRLSMAAP